MINQIKLDFNRNHAKFEKIDKNKYYFEFPVFATNSVDYIYHIILDKNADYIYAYNKVNPIGITAEGVFLNERKWHISIERFLELKFKKWYQEH